MLRRDYHTVRPQKALQIGSAEVPVVIIMVEQPWPEHTIEKPQLRDAADAMTDMAS
jgi:hypothetical protein